MQHFLVIYNPTGHLYFHGIHTHLKASVYTKKIQVSHGILHGIHTLLKACVYTKKIQVTSEILHGIPLKSIA